MNSFLNGFFGQGGGVYCSRDAGCSVVDVCATAFFLEVSGGRD